MKHIILLLLLSVSFTYSVKAQITPELLAALPALEVNKDYTYQALKEKSDQLNKTLKLIDAYDKENTHQAIAKLNVGEEHYLMIFNEYYDPASEFAAGIELRRYNPQNLQDYAREARYVDFSLFIHNATFTKIKRTLRFENQLIVTKNETESIRLVRRSALNRLDGLGQEELFINPDEFPELPLGQEIDIKKMVEIIESSKSETFCNVDGYCHFNVVGKVQGKKYLYIFLGYQYDLEDEYDDYYSVSRITVRGKNLKGWISPDNWYPFDERGIETFMVSTDKTELIIKQDGETRIQKLR